MPRKVRPGLLLYAPTCALLLVPPLPVAGQTAEPKTETTVQSGAPKGAKISEDQAKQAALNAVPGKVTDLAVETKRGKEVYVVEIVAQKNGEETDVLVDMDTGKVIAVER